MFGRLKDKLKGALKTFSKEVEEEADVVEETLEELEVVEEKPKAKKEEKKETSKPKKEKKKEEVKEEPKPNSKKEEKDIPEEKPAPKEEKKPEEKIVLKEEKKVEVVKDEPEEVQETTKEADIEETTEDEPLVEEDKPEEVVEEQKQKKSFFGKVFGKKDKVEEEKTDEVKEEEITEVIDETLEEEEPKTEESVNIIEEEKSEELEVEEEKPRRREGFFSKLTRVTLTEEKFENLFWDLEVALLENNVAVEVIEKIKEDLKQALNGEKASKKNIEELILETLHNTLKEILSVKPIDLLKLAEEKNKEGKPLIITMIGVNGSGKTTTLAKLVKYFQNNNKSLVVAAADTFRAAAIHQLEEHTTKLGVKLIKHDYNADPAAVAFDAVKHAIAKNLDIVLVDSAGRLHSNDNLMNELKKLIRINNPDVNIFVGEAITGNDCVEQATLFDQAVGIDAIILAKADVDEKGGAAISASFVTGKPVIFLGVGQGYDDLQAFDPELVLKSLDL